MDQLLLNRLRCRKELLQKIVKEKRAAVKEVPPGSMKFVRRKSRTEYYWRKPGTGKYVYLNKDKRDLATQPLNTREVERVVRHYFL